LELKPLETGAHVLPVASKVLQEVIHHLHWNDVAGRKERRKGRRVRMKGKESAWERKSKMHASIIYVRKREINTGGRGEVGRQNKRG